MRTGLLIRKTEGKNQLGLHKPERSVILKFILNKQNGKS
jgi:hypothetical protein